MLKKMLKWAQVIACNILGEGVVGAFIIKLSTIADGTILELRGLAGMDIREVLKLSPVAISKRKPGLDHPKCGKEIESGYIPASGYLVGMGYIQIRKS